MSLFNVFSDPKLRSRQDTLDAQWKSLRATFNTCNNTPDSSFPEFTTDYNGWTRFYESESDWDADSNNATNVWQATAKSWSDRMNQWGCTGNFDSTPQTGGPSGIPGVKDPPPDQKSFVSEIGSDIKNVGTDFWHSLTTIGWVLAGVLVLLIVGAFYVLTHAKVSAPGIGSVG